MFTWTYTFVFDIQENNCVIAFYYTILMHIRNTNWQGIKLLQN